MPIFQLTKELIFPSPYLAEDGVLAIGGDLSPERLLLAYQNGIFPWYSKDDPIVWHAPNPRFVLYPSNFKCSKSLNRLYHQNKYSFRINNNFASVVKHCKSVARKDQEGTWITSEMQAAYLKLHQLGYAHSVEVYNKNLKLVGGLYGILLGNVFFGESMFHLESNTSKLAFVHLIEKIPLKLIDCQVYTKHLESLGAEEISLNIFLDHLKKYC